MKKTSRQKIWMFAGGSIPVTYRKIKRAKHIRIHISSSERILVTGAYSVLFRELESFFKSHQVWVKEKISHFQKFPNKTIRLSEVRYKQKKEAARKLVHQKLEYWNQYYNRTWNRVAIRNQRTRWGSCSSKGTLSFHAAIIDLPEDLQDYLVVHELCHLSAMNHSPAFWKSVQKSFPNAKVLDARLKKYTGTSIL